MELSGSKVSLQGMIKELRLLTVKKKYKPLHFRCSIKATTAQLVQTLI